MTNRTRPSKPKTIYTAYAAVSIDGRISLDSKKLPDWTSSEDWKFFQSELKKSDAVVVGHTTYKAVSERLQKRVTYVLTTKIKKPEVQGTVTFVNPKYTNLSVLLAKHKKVAIAGGAAAYQIMLELGLFNVLYLTIEPLVFGRGRELFVGGKKNFQFKLKSVKKLNKTGTLLLCYIK